MKFDKTFMYEGTKVYIQYLFKPGSSYLKNIYLDVDAEVKILFGLVFRAHEILHKDIKAISARMLDKRTENQNSRDWDIKRLAGIEEASSCVEALPYGRGD